MSEHDEHQDEQDTPTEKNMLRTVAMMVGSALLTPVCYLADTDALADGETDREKMRPCYGVIRWGNGIVHLMDATIAMQASIACELKDESWTKLMDRVTTYVAAGVPGDLKVVDGLMVVFVCDDEHPLMHFPQDTVVGAIANSVTDLSTGDPIPQETLDKVMAGALSHGASGVI